MVGVALDEELAVRGVHRLRRDGHLSDRLEDFDEMRALRQCPRERGERGSILDDERGDGRDLAAVGRQGERRAGGDLNRAGDAAGQAQRSVRDDGRARVGVGGGEGDDARTGTSSGSPQAR